MLWFGTCERELCYYNKIRGEQHLQLNKVLERRSRLSVSSITSSRLQFIGAWDGLLIGTAAWKVVNVLLFSKTYLPFHWLSRSPGVLHFSGDSFGLYPGQGSDCAPKNVLQLTICLLIVCAA